jgi:hypothetical protein
MESHFIPRQFGGLRFDRKGFTNPKSNNMKPDLFKVSFDWLIIFQHNLGLLAIMDEECQRPCNGSEETFLNKVGQVFQDNIQVEVAWGLPSKSSDSTTVNAFR